MFGFFKKLTGNPATQPQAQEGGRRTRRRRRGRKCKGGSAMVGQGQDLQAEEPATEMGGGRRRRKSRKSRRGTRKHTRRHRR